MSTILEKRGQGLSRLLPSFFICQRDIIEVSETFSAEEGLAIIGLCVFYFSQAEIQSSTTITKNKSSTVFKSLSVVVVGVVDEGGDEGALEDASAQEETTLDQLLPLDVRVVEVACIYQTKRDIASLMQYNWFSPYQLSNPNSLYPQRPSTPMQRNESISWLVYWFYMFLKKFSSFRFKGLGKSSKITFFLQSGQGLTPAPIPP